MTKKQKKKYRNVGAFCLRNEYELVEEYIDLFKGKIKKGTKLIFSHYNLGYAKFAVKNSKVFKSIGIPSGEVFKIVKKRL